MMGANTFIRRFRGASRGAWTVVLVPEGSEAPLTLRVRPRATRAFGVIAAGTGVMVITALLSIALDLTGHSPFADAGARRQAQMLASLRRQVVTLRDTVASMAGRETEIRTLAGLEPADSLLKPDSNSARTPMPTGDIGALIERASALATRFDEASAALHRDVDRAARTPSIMPTTGWLSSQFSLSRFHPILHINRPHEGIDIAAPYGMPVVAPAAGTVLRVTRQFGYGLVLEIDHGNNIVTKYAHLSRTLVRQGQRVVRGDPIAAVGNSGLATGPHLHYEVHVNGRVVNPLTYVLPESIPN
jgi:murein DD-endopeptidase MepM/ murein hydrolase activator NlpD